MVTWTESQRGIIDRHAAGEPVASGLVKCTSCLLIIAETDLIDGLLCPGCGAAEYLVHMCPLDSCRCSHPITEGVAACPVCTKPVCPQCGSHDVAQISRVTGYLGDVAGWNQAKKQELKDRTRYNAETGEIAQGGVR